MTLMMEYREKYNEGKADGRVEERAEWEEKEATWTLDVYFIFSRVNSTRFEACRD